MEKNPSSWVKERGSTKAIMKRFCKLNIYRPTQTLYGSLLLGRVAVTAHWEGFQRELVHKVSVQFGLLFKLVPKLPSFSVLLQILQQESSKRVWDKSQYSDHCAAEWLGEGKLQAKWVCRLLSVPVVPCPYFFLIHLMLSFNILSTGCPWLLNC